jgi:hypothetical protein
MWGGGGGQRVRLAATRTEQGYSDALVEERPAMAVAEPAWGGGTDHEEGGSREVRVLITQS